MLSRLAQITTALLLVLHCSVAHSQAVHEYEFDSNQKNKVFKLTVARLDKTKWYGNSPLSRMSEWRNGNYGNVNAMFYDYQCAPEKCKDYVAINLSQHYIGWFTDKEPCKFSETLPPMIIKEILASNPMPEKLQVADFQSQIQNNGNEIKYCNFNFRLKNSQLNTAFVGRTYDFHKTYGVIIVGSADQKEGAEEYSSFIESVKVSLVDTSTASVGK